MKKTAKRILAMILMLLLAMSVMACGKKESGDENETKGTQKGFAIQIDGVTIRLGEQAEKTLTALRTPLSQNELFDCGAGNSRMLYRYASFDLYTMKSGETEVIDQIEVKDDFCETEKGLCIGAEESAVVAVYGEATRKGEGSLTYVSGNQELTFDVENGQVVGIGLLRVTQ